MIKTVKLFPLIFKGDWCFRLSVSTDEYSSDHQNIMLFGFNMYDRTVFKIRFFQTVDSASEWVDEVCT